jgi:hypothetical protein
MVSLSPNLINAVCYFGNEPEFGVMVVKLTSL